MNNPSPTITAATTAEDLASVATLFRAYGDSLPIDLFSHGFGAELDRLPGDYGPPGGGLWLARSAAGAALGCIALRALGTDGICEMKRLYLRPEARGLGLGRALAGTACAAARRLGYREMRLDTLPDLGAAVALYRAPGFPPIADCNDSPFPGTLFFSLSL